MILILNTGKEIGHFPIHLMLAYVSKEFEERMENAFLQEESI